MIRPLLAIFVVCVVVTAGLSDPPIGSQTTIVPGTLAPDRIEEDEPGWDCRTMGNRLCGPITDSEVSRR
jgi:hypothetical protein